MFETNGKKGGEVQRLRKERVELKQIIEGLTVELTKQKKNCDEKEGFRIGKRAERGATEKDEENKR